MSSDVKIPEWAMEEAAKALGVPEDDTGWHLTGDVLPAIARALLAAEQRGRKAGLEEAAKVADAYAEVNWEQCTDSILLDPVLSNRGERALTKDDWVRSESMSIDGTIHSSMYHAATNIAAAIRSLGEKT